MTIPAIPPFRGRLDHLDLARAGLQSAADFVRNTPANTAAQLTAFTQVLTELTGTITDLTNRQGEMATNVATLGATVAGLGRSSSRDSRARSVSWFQYLTQCATAPYDYAYTTGKAFVSLTGVTWGASKIGQGISESFNFQPGIQYCGDVADKIESNVAPVVSGSFHKLLTLGGQTIWNTISSAVWNTNQDSSPTNSNQGTRQSLFGNTNTVKMAQEGFDSFVNQELDSLDVPEMAYETWKDIAQPASSIPFETIIPVAVLSATLGLSVYAYTYFEAKKAAQKRAQESNN